MKTHTFGRRLPACSRSYRFGPVAAAPTRSLGVLALLFCLAAGVAWGQAQPGPDDPAQVAAQLANVERLLETSSGAQRVDRSDNALAHKIRDDARERHRSAHAAYDRGEYAQARRLLEEAAKSMFQAIRILGPPTEITDKKVQDFDGREASTRALMDALRRIAAQEGASDEAAGTLAGVEQTVVAARKLLAAGAYEDARRMLDDAYEQAKAAVEQRRDGKTLVRSLHFETDQDEYRYEMDRNDTHQMLVRVVLQERQPGAQARSLVDASMARAAELRQQAEQSAAGGAFREAIRLLELSTKELVRAIRGAGLYIPG